MNLDTYTHLLFDFGGVIYRLDEDKTFSQLAPYFDCATKDVMPLLIERARFYEYECGKISTDTFISAVQHAVVKPLSRHDFIDIWNAMLLGFPIEHVSLLQNVRKHFSIHLLSNTNELHVQAFEENMRKQGIVYTLHDLFDNVWYSHEIHRRKPDTLTYTHVMNHANIEPSQTLFLDDKPENLRGAEQAGVDTVHIDSNNSIMHICKAYR
ncbi:MAG: HAD-IA family hydrolase [Bacteroidales bacterium]